MTVTILGKNLNLGCMIMLAYPLRKQTETNSVFGPWHLYCLIIVLGKHGKLKRVSTAWEVQDGIGWIYYVNNMLNM